MYLFSRTRVAHSAHLGAAVGAAVEAGKRATDVSGIEVSTWISMMSPAANTLGWTCLVEHLADLEAGMDKLMADAAYNEFITNADSLFEGPLTDRLVSLVTPMPETAEVANYVAVVEGVAAPGSIGAAVQHGIAIAQAADKASGGTTLFGVATTGPYGGLAWFTGAPDIASLEAMENAINADPSFLALVDSGGALFQPQALQTIYRRLA